MKLEDEYQEYLKKMDRIGITELSLMNYTETRIIATNQIQQMMDQNQNLFPSDVMVIATVTSDLAARNMNRAAQK